MLLRGGQGGHKWTPRTKEDGAARCLWRLGMHRGGLGGQVDAKGHGVDQSKGTDTAVDRPPFP